MDSPDIMISGDSGASPNLIESSNPMQSGEEDTTLRAEVMSNLQKPNIPNVNVPEKIIICLDVCYNNQNSLFRIADGTTYTPLNMMKRVLDFFLYTKKAISSRTEFALVILKDSEAIWVQNFTNNLKDILNAIDLLGSEECTWKHFDFLKLFKLIKQKVEIPEYKDSERILPPLYIVRMIVLYGRSNCMPVIPQEDPYFIFLKKQLYFYIDILLAHEEDCTQYKCEYIYYALQDLDNGYSYVYEVSRNAAKIHDSIAKLLAHPLQRPLQKNTDYSFGTKC